MKSSLQDYTELDFLNLLIDSEKDDFDDELLDELVDFFNSVIRHPKGSALLTHPSMVGIDDTPEAIIVELKRWYSEQGLPCFKE